MNYSIKDSVGFFGYFQAENVWLPRVSYNIWVFNTNKTAGEINNANDTGSVYIEVYKKISCQEFKANFDINAEINPAWPILIGALQLGGKLRD